MQLKMAVKRLLQRKRQPKLHERHLQDLVRYDLGDGVFLAAYWKVTSEGRGPCSSLYVGENEVLRFDCFGERKGHYHTHLYEWDVQESPKWRIYFLKKLIEEQVEGAAREIKTNSVRYLTESRHKKIRLVHIDPKRLEEAVNQMRDQMLVYIKRSTS